MKKLTTRNIRTTKRSKGHSALQMLTCYDFQTAQMLNQSSLDMLLVGDSLGNVVLGLETTVPVKVEEMQLFANAVKRGAPDKFIVADLPFGSYADEPSALKNAVQLFQATGVQALKLEGAHNYLLPIITRLTQIGIPVMGHIGLTPQSVHELGGYYQHGKTQQAADFLVDAAIKLQSAGCFSLVLECVVESVAAQITQELDIPTIGIGSGTQVDGQVLVINDLFKQGATTPPKFCTPIADLYELRLGLIEQYLSKQRKNSIVNDSIRLQ